MTLETAIHLRQQGELTRAQEILEQMLETTPEDPLVHFHLATTCIGQGDDRTAMDHYKAAIDAGLPSEEDGQA
ncbi:MAG: tetratricopeptide repeat protein, partial [Alkalispirochaeta sp.]